MIINQIVTIKSLPIRIKLKVFKYFNYQSCIVGYKKIQSNYNLLIVQLSDYTRIWVLAKEIQ